MEWSEHLAWGAYAYWTLWFIEIFAALLLLLEKAKAQQVLQNAMMLPFALFFPSSCTQSPISGSRGYNGRS